MSLFDASLRAVGGVDGVKRCLRVGNDAPLLIVLEDAGKETAALRAELAEARAVLRAVEWSKTDVNGDGRCPVCNAARYGHFPGCRLKKALEA